MSEGTLHGLLEELLERTGAQAARVLDGRTGTVLGAAAATPDDPVDDAPALVRLAALAGSAAAAEGGLHDVVLATGRAVHVLRATGMRGSFLHVRLPAGSADLAAARHELAAAAWHPAFRLGTTCAAEPLPRRVPSPPAAGARSTRPRPRPTPTGAVAPAPRPCPYPRPRPYPWPRQAAVPAPARPTWASDVATMRRVLTALRHRGALGGGRAGGAGL